MTITPFDIYLISLVDTLKEVFLIACVLPVALVFFIYIEILEKRFLRKILKIGVPFFIFFLLGTIFMPSTKTLIAMYSIPPIINVKSTQKLPVNLINFANNWLKKDTTKK